MDLDEQGFNDAVDDYFGNPSDPSEDLLEHDDSINTFSKLDHSFERKLLRNLTYWQIDGIHELPLLQAVITVLLLWGFSREDIAKTLKIKRNTVKTMCMRARLRLIKYKEQITVNFEE
jgi:DNA-directed RNA polymerase specialized sigma24 family protein